MSHLRSKALKLEYRFIGHVGWDQFYITDLMKDLLLATAKRSGPALPHSPFASARADVWLILLSFPFQDPSSP